MINKEDTSLIQFEKMPDEILKARFRNFSELNFIDHNDGLKIEQSFPFEENINGISDLAIQCYSYRKEYYQNIADNNNQWYNIGYDLWSSDCDIDDLESIRRLNSLKSNNETKLNSYRNSFKKAKDYFSKLFSSESNNQEENRFDIDFFDNLNANEINELAEALSIRIIDKIDSSKTSYSLWELFYFERRIEEVFQLLNSINDTLKYLVRLFSKLFCKLFRNKRYYFRKINSIPFKNLDDYHSLCFKIS